ncbi:MAG: GNAT family N-acetyltransferase [Patescibacteria group bacterium]|jgi:amino-acid N-acetyltransferase
MKIIIRQAVVSDIVKIHDLIKLYAKEELLLPKSRAELTVMLPNFLAADYDGQFAGSVAFKIGEDEKAEIVSWVVDKKYFNHGIGSMLISAVMERIEDLGIKIVYTLTLRPNTFEKHGFKKVGMEMLPKKMWTDCIRCPRNIAVPGSVDCKEIALIKNF